MPCFLVPAVHRPNVLSRPAGRGAMGVEPPALPEKSAQKFLGLPFCCTVEHERYSNTELSIIYFRCNGAGVLSSLITMIVNLIDAILAGSIAEMILIAQTVLFMLIFVRPLLMP